jgi:FKBP-type peptidyl-prolyl cis-trans isomerase 2
MVRAKIGDTVAVHYIGTLDNGRIFDSTQEVGPLCFTLGAGEVFPALEAAVVGMAAGEVKNIQIPAAEAYGLRRRENIKVLRRQKLPPGAEPRPGQKVQICLASGRELSMRVMAVSEDAVTLDGNHALAGLDLTFALRLESID